MPHQILTPRNLPLPNPSRTGVGNSTGPLPTYMIIWTASQRMKLAKAEADKKDMREAERARTSRPMKGSFLMGPLHRISSTSDALVPIPDSYSNSLFHKIYFLLHWWTDHQLQSFSDQPQSIPKTDIGDGGARVSVVEMGKAERLLGTDDFAALTPGL
ncbi:hypothetical protein B0H13DRAFT_1853397 [Mycena leptocephala]|nr:hypothetical protein B0H13DRAFT_1853397 [Mycena leptocephala]